MNTITVTELQQQLQQDNTVFLLDVRELHEYTAFNIKGHLIPLQELPSRLQEIPQDKPIVVYCRSGRRSEMAMHFLISQGFNEVKNLIGGMEAWQQTFNLA